EQPPPRRLVHTCGSSRTRLVRRKAVSAQSLSLSIVAGGQQSPSLFLAGTTSLRHVAWQVPPPVSVAGVQRSPEAHVVGHEPSPARIAVSQDSPGSTAPLPQSDIASGDSGASWLSTGASGVSIGASSVGASTPPPDGASPPWHRRSPEHRQAPWRPA